ncbi:YcdB/YcdC domain-containing protein [Paenibacillus cellulositrophicus]|uniref:YcdB/YcdC domain-containing protein n=1 Tax=Paenibacillus cellulositrophicus TaxID=562959 RepID=UPI00203B0C8F|nr:YcdB/YcdC domain-containing protein [Paenibacillus cellulositrophicus]MCM2998884.1 S-layer homology domain-containing protein [Paenibacillus cellulositrophicus]
MDEQQHAAGMPKNQAKERSLRNTSVAKKVLAGTLGLSLLQVPLLASADTVSGTSVVKDSVVSASQDSGSTASKGLNPADAKITKAQAESRIRSLFPELKDAKLNGVTYGEQNVYPSNTKKVWEQNWTIQQGNHSMGFSTEVDAITGDILSYSYPYMYPLDDSNTAYYPPAVSEQEAQKIAEAFIPKAAPSIKAGTMKPSNQNLYSSNKALFGPVQYSFSYTIDVNGIPADNESVSLDVDGNGNIVRFNRNTYQGDYPAAKATISKEDAEKRLEQGLSVTLAYIPSTSLYDTSANREWKIGYVPDRTLEPMDANSGKRIDTIFGKDLEGPSQAVSYTALKASGKLFTPNKGGQLTSDEVLQRLQGIAPGPDYQVQSNLSNYWGGTGKQVWSLNWNKRTAGINRDDSKYAYVDADTGQLLSYHQFQYPDAEPAKATAPSVTEAQAQAKAIELVLAHYPNAAEALKLSDAKTLNTATKTVYQFVFQRFYKDLPVNGMTVSVSIDGSGKLLSYNADTYLSDKDIKALDTLTAKVDAKDAQQRLLDDLSVELRYISSGGYPVDNTYVEPTVRLAYVPTLNGDRNVGYIDGVTGKTEASSLLPVSNKDKSAALPSDAANHAASKDLATLLEYRVLSPGEDGLLHPDAELTLGDWIQMMAKGVYPDQGYYGGQYQPVFTDVPADSPIAGAVQLFMDKGWLKDVKSSELHPEQKLTREAVATSLTTALHYNRLSKFFQQDAQALSLSDANAIQDKGAVALMLKLGLMDAAGGKFDPAKPVTKAEAATIMVRLAHLQSKVDTPLNQRRY